MARYNERFGFGFLNDETHAGLVKQVYDLCGKEIIPAHLRKLDKLMARGGTKWMGGTEQPSIADFHWAPLLNMFNSGRWVFPKGCINGSR